MSSAGRYERDQFGTELRKELASQFWLPPRQEVMFQVWGALEDHTGADLAYLLGDHLIAMLWREGRT